MLKARPERDEACYSVAEPGEKVAGFPVEDLSFPWGKD
jgi:hypothetical protein